MLETWCPDDVDMSPQGIEARIHEVASLNRLCESLAAAGEHLHAPKEESAEMNAPAMQLTATHHEDEAL